MDQFSFIARNATLNDLPQLLDLEREWPELERATEEELRFRMNRFPEGYWVAEFEGEIVGSIIACPMNYNASKLDFKNWKHSKEIGYSSENLSSSTNALYIVSGTVKQAFQNPKIFAIGVNSIIQTAQKLNKSYVIAGALIPGYSNYLKKFPELLPEQYVFKKIGSRFVDPLIEKYRRIGFTVPDKEHILKDYFPDDNSLNYSVLVIKNITQDLNPIC